MKYILSLAAACLSLMGAHAAMPTDSALTVNQLPTDSLTRDAFVAERHPRSVTAAAEVVGLNLAVWSFNRFVTREDFARINAHTIRTNLRSLPVWDTDQFVTNLLAHPYHGSLYFNAARASGHTFWQSVPYTFGGSLMWEYFMENELPSANDLLATTLGGIELGEITFRLSDLIIDDRLSGFPRVVREVAGGLASPMRGLNRLLTGEAWRVRATRGQLFTHGPVRLSLYGGPRFLAEERRSRGGEVSLNLGFRLTYGELFGDDYYSPYEYFRIHASFDLLSHQPVISRVNAIAALWGREVWQSGARTLSVGVFQHFDYYNSQIRSRTGRLVAPYRIAEAAALGGGLIYLRRAIPGHHFDIRHEFYVNGIALGASLSDYFHVDNRDYNLGSGYSIKTYTGLIFRQRWGLGLQLERYHIFTWKGYDPAVDLSTVDYHRLNVQGDAGNALLGVFTSCLSYHAQQGWNLGLAHNLYSRRTNYRYHPNVEYATSDVLLTAGYTF